MNIKQLVIVAFSSVILVSCGGDTTPEKTTDHVKKEVKKAVEKVTTAEADPMKNKGIGPIKSVTLGDIDEAMAAKGKETFKTNCKACHKMKKTIHWAWT